MADRWLYTHAGAAHGPVDLEKLTQLAAQGKLLRTDRVWPVGEDMRRAVEAHTLLNPESFRAAHLKVEETVANPPQPAGAHPDWLTDVAAFSAPAPPSSPEAEATNGTAGAAGEAPDVEVVAEEPVPLALPTVPLAEPIPAETPSSATARKRSVAAKRKAARRPAVEQADEPDDDEDEGDAEEGGLGFRRRDLVAFGLGVIGVSLAVAAGLFFAKPWRRTTDEAPQDDRRKEKP